MTRSQGAGSVAPANEEAVRAWDTVLYERWKKNRKVFVGALEEVTAEFSIAIRHPRTGAASTSAADSARTTQQLAGSSGPAASRSAPTPPPVSPRMPVARRPKQGLRMSSSKPSTHRPRSGSPSYDYVFSRMGTQFFAAPVPAMRAIRGGLKPGGGLRKICWRRKDDSPFWAETEQVVGRFLSRPDEYEADTCGPGPFSLGNPAHPCGAFSRRPGTRRSSCISATSTLSWARTWPRRSTRCSRSARSRADSSQRRARQSRRVEIADALADHYAPGSGPTDR